MYFFYTVKSYGVEFHHTYIVNMYIICEQNIRIEVKIDILLIRSSFQEGLKQDKYSGR